jgi:hypothetical protein
MGEIMIFKTLKTLSLGFLFSVFAQPSFSQAVTWNEDVRGWFIGVDRTLGDGCFMYSSFDSGGVLRAGFDVDGDSMYIVVGSRNWMSLEEGKLYPIEIQFGSRPPWTGDANVFVWNDGDKALELSVPFTNNVADNFVRELQQTQNVLVRYQGRQILNLSLRGSFAAMAEVIKCQEAMLSNSLPNADPFNAGGVNGNDPFR